MTKLEKIVKELQEYYESNALPSRSLRELVYQTTGILKEAEQKAEGGFFSLSYINEKLDSIRYYARGAANE